MNKKNIPERDTILFVDDEKICHTLVDLIIPNFTKYRLINAYDSEDAIALAKRYENNICLILTDIMLHGTNGYQLYAILKKDKKLRNIPFIFQSGLPTQEIELKAHIAEPVEIIYKPYTQAELLEMISKVVGEI